MSKKKTLQHELEQVTKKIGELHLQIDAATQNETIMLSARVPKELRQRAKLQALKKGENLQTYLTNAINNAVTKDEQNN